MNDGSFLRFLADTNYLREVLPISQETSDILHAVLHPDPIARIDIPELRQRIIAVKDFYMSKEDLAVASDHVKMAAETYSPPKPIEELVHAQSIFNDEDARALLEGVSVFSKVILLSQPSADPTDLRSKFVIASSSSGSCSSSEESDEPVTPVTHAHDAAKLVDIPELTEGEKIGDAIVPIVRKGHTMPADIAPRIRISVRLRYL